jgi:glycosyltransferase involved in cell wall biosynthesis
MTSAYEGLPMIITEALQKGCVPVCMDSFGAIHEMINDGIDGFIIPDKDIKNFTEKTELLLSNYEIRNRMMFNGRNNSRRFSMSKIGPKWIDLFKQVLS